MAINDRITDIRMPLLAIILVEERRNQMTNIAPAICSDNEIN